LYRAVVSVVESIFIHQDDVVARTNCALTSRLT